MKKNLLFGILLLAWTTGVLAQPDNAINYGNNPAAGGYKKVNGIRMYYEIYGEGRPLVILHGNGGSIHNHASRIAYFQKFFKVIAIDSRGHGHSVDSVSKRLDYDQMANDTKVLLDSLHVDSAFIWGQSDGGILGLILAYKYPVKVARLATYGANLFPGNKAIFNEIEDLIQQVLRTTTDPSKKRLFDLVENGPHIETTDLNKISAPTLIMAGDRDAIRPEHSLLIFNNIPNSNLFIMPGATHFGSAEKPDLFFFVLMDFYTKPFNKKSTFEAFTGK